MVRLEAILLVAACVLLACCSGDEVVDFNTDFPAYYPIESEPALTPDRQSIYYVRADTTALKKEGIYRLLVARPEREEILAGSNYHNPSSLARQLAVAFLDSSKISIYRLYDSTHVAVNVGGSYSSLLYVNDSILIAGTDSGLYRVNLHDNSVVRFNDGWDPTMLSGDTIACIHPAGLDKFAVVLQPVFDTLGQSLAIIPSVDRPRWASVEPRLRRFVYALPSGAGFIIYSQEKGDNAVHTIGGSRYPQACMIDFNLLILTGPDGRFYQSDFLGTFSFPFQYHYDDTR